MSLTKNWTGGAIFSDDLVYRYLLDRHSMDDKARPVHMLGKKYDKAVFIMLNPSTATAEKNDPTVRRCMGFAEAWGFSSMAVLNLFAYRATDPEKLKYADHDFVVGPENDEFIKAHCGPAESCWNPLVIAAWGVHGHMYNRANEVLDLLWNNNVDTHALALTKDSNPRHPLYLPSISYPKLYL